MKKLILILICLFAMDSYAQAVSLKGQTETKGNLQNQNINNSQSNVKKSDNRPSISNSDSRNMNGTSSQSTYKPSGPSSTRKTYTKLEDFKKDLKNFKLSEKELAKAQQDVDGALESLILADINKDGVLSVKEQGYYSQMIKNPDLKEKLKQKLR